MSASPLEGYCPKREPGPEVYLQPHSPLRHACLEVPMACALLRERKTTSAPTRSDSCSGGETPLCPLDHGRDGGKEARAQTRRREITGSPEEVPSLSCKNTLHCLLGLRHSDNWQKTPKTFPCEFDCKITSSPTPQQDAHHSLGKKMLYKVTSLSDIYSYKATRF